MADDTTPVPGVPGAPPPEPKVVDLDAGDTYGTETVALERPFRFKGAVYREVRVRVPNGWDVARFINRPSGRADATGLMVHLTELPEAVFDAMYAADRNAVDVAVGKHMAGSRRTSTI